MKYLNNISNTFKPFNNRISFFKFSNNDKYSNIKTNKNKYNYKKLYFGKDARSIISNGVYSITNNVSITFGPLGRNFAIENKDNINNPVIITKDGITVANNIDFKSRKDSLGIKLLSSISGNTNLFAGDGTTTSCVLAGFLVNHGNYLINNGYDYSSIKDGIALSKDIMLSILKKIRVSANDKKHLYNLSMITTLGDTILSDVVSNAVYNAKNLSDIILEESPYKETLLINTNAFVIPNGIEDYEIYNDINYKHQNKNKNKNLHNNKYEEYKKLFKVKEEFNNNTLKWPLILVIDKEIEHQIEIEGSFEFAKELNKPLIIFCKDIGDDIMSYIKKFNKDNMNNLYKIYPIVIPDYSSDDYNSQVLRDISIVVGSKLIDEFDNIDFLSGEELYGTTESLTIEKYESILVNPKGDTYEINNRIIELENFLSLNENILTEENIFNLKKRIKRLNQKTSLILIGGDSEVERHNNRDKLIDALNSCESVLNNGVLPGGGNAYLFGVIHSNEIFKRILNYVNNNSKDNTIYCDINYNLCNILDLNLDLSLLTKSEIINKQKINSNSFKLGYKIFNESVLDLVRLLYKNNKDYSGDKIISDYYNNTKIRDKKNVQSLISYGFDLKSNKFVNNVIEIGILDSFKTIETAIIDSTNLASLIISTDCLILNESDYKPPPLAILHQKWRDDTDLRKATRESYNEVVENKQENNFDINSFL